MRFISAILNPAIWSCVCCPSKAGMPQTGWASYSLMERRESAVWQEERPTWFCGEIVNPEVFIENMMYGGMAHTGWAYLTH